MFIITIIISFIIILLKGKLKEINNENFKEINFKGIYFLLGAILFKIGMLFLSLKIGAVANFFFKYNIISLVSLGFIFIFLLMNFREKGFIIITIGSFLNFIVIIMNRGFMPVSEKALAIIGKYNQINILKNGGSLTHSLINNNTKLWVLGDVIPIIKPWIFPVVISIGDIAISCGMIIYITNIFIGGRDE